MLDYIEKLQQKPEPVRRRILYVSVTFIMAIIVLGWLATLPLRFDENGQNKRERGLSPFQVVGEQIQEWYADFWRGIDRIKS